MRLFYEEDLVTLIGDAREAVAIVVLTWHEDGDDDDEEDEEVDLVENKYLIKWLPNHRQIVDGDDLILKDRSFQVGDICRSMTQADSDISSGVVTNVLLELALQSVVTSSKQSEWIGTTNVCKSACIEEGDHVIYKNWVGVVELVFEEALLTVRGTNRPFKVFCVEGGLQYGTPSESLLDTMQGLVNGKSLGSHITPRNSRVAAIRQTAVLVSWLAINQKLSRQQEALFPEPKAIWATDLEELTIIQPFQEHKFALGDTVFITNDKEKNDPVCFNDDKVQQVYNTRSEIEVLWQDGSRTWQSSTLLEQPAVIEDHHVWPGDHIVYRDAEAKEMGAVVQSMDPSEQMVCIITYSNEEKESILVSALDCKLEGSPDYLHGISRGDVVLISSRETGFTPPSIARLGKVEQSYLNEEEQEEKLIDEGRATARKASRSQLSTQKRPKSARETHEIDWYGVVVDCASSGRIIIKLPDGKRIEERVDRLSSLVDGLEDDAASSDGSSWDSTDDEELIPWTGKDDTNVNGGEAEEWGDDVDAESQEDESSDETQPLPSTDYTTFKVLESAPIDHAFLGHSHLVPQQKTFLSKIQREHKILSSSLPDTILVRTYEDRLDLFRAIIIGSQGTPYEDAPICIDLQLQASYPFDPPVAFFHSWSRGLGKINPHLYEDGSVCLSLLNTWQGDKTEAWSPTKSTLLQVLVSIQGLILIAEPGLETEQIHVSQQSNMLYSEKAYVLSRNFIVHALANGVKGFESDLQVVYCTQRRLSSAIQKAHHLLDPEMTTAIEGGFQLTKGGAIALRRVVGEMEQLTL